jgi:hypothetical protein
MSFAGRVGDAVANRTMQVIGVLLGLGGVAHFWTWTDGAGAGQQFSNAVGTGSLLAAMPELATYAQTHPAYVAAVVAGVALLVRGE